MRHIALALLGVILTPLASAITDGWYAEEELAHRKWTPANLAWAVSVHPDPLPVGQLRHYVSPPPREMWCDQAAAWEEYCEAWEYSMSQWLHHYLDIHYSDPLPNNLPPFPKECPSSCKRY